MYTMDRVRIGAIDFKAMIFLQWHKDLKFNFFFFF